MSIWIIPPITGLIEPALAPEFYVDGIGAIEIIGMSVRIYLMCEQLPLEAGGNETNKIVPVKLVGQISNIPQIIGQLAACLWRGPVQSDASPAPGGFHPHIVR